ncbi:MAG: cell wall hydrolase [Gammaproteobacteria bacterium]|nr:cell wall hydrolase [Gammaproteobacteria bacterium]
MTKYIKLTLNLSAFLIVALLSLTLVSYITHDKLDRLTASNTSGVSTISEYKAAVKDKERRMQCMTQNIYWEAASEPAEGKLAVAQVVMNRVESGKFPNDPCQVVHQKNVIYERVLCQFSWYCEQNFKTKPVHKKLWDESAEAAKMVMIDGFRLPELKDALYYHADYINPQWNKKRVTKIGRHIFYKDF